MKDKWKINNTGKTGRRRSYGYKEADYFIAGSFFMSDGVCKTGSGSRTSKD